MPLRTYQEFFAAAVNPKARLTAGVNLQGPSQWGWPALDLMGVRWFITAGLPGRGDQGDGGQGLPDRGVGPPTSWSGSGRRRRWLACTTTWM